MRARAARPEATSAPDACRSSRKRPGSCGTSASARVALLGRPRRHVAAVQLDRAGARPVEAGEQPQRASSCRCRWPRASAHDGAGPDVEVEAVAAPARRRGRRASPRAASTTSPRRPRRRAAASSSGGVAADIDDAVGDGVDAVAAVLGDQHGGPASARRADQRHERRGGLVVELRGRLVEQQHGRLGREHAGQRDALQLAARERCRPCGRRGRARRRAAERARASAARARRRRTPWFERPKATSRSTDAVHDLRLGILEGDARAAGDGRRRRGAGVEAVDRARGRAKRPPWKCGTSPANARRSVVLPPPDGPASSTISPRRSSRSTPSSTSVAAPG